MTLPNGAMEINSILSYNFNNVHYITDKTENGVETSKWNRSFFNNNGKPLKNLIRENINSAILTTLNDSLPESGNMIETIFDHNRYSELLLDSTKNRYKYK
jgi:hypothetical protein